MKYVPASITRFAGRQSLHIQQASPRLLLTVGIVGAVGATVLACRATLQVESILVDAQKDLQEVEYTVKQEYRRKEVVHIRIRTFQKLVKIYSPAVVVGIGSVACLTKSHQILSSRNAALTAAYTALGQRFDSYRDRVTEELGREKENEIYQDLAPCEIEDPETGKKIKQIGPSGRGGSIYARWFDKNSPSWENVRESNVYFLRMQQNHWNERLHTKGHVFLNEVYDSLGLPRTPEGQIVGWVHDEGDSYISFNVFDSDEMDRLQDFVLGLEDGIWLDFNVDGPIHNKLNKI